MHRHYHKKTFPALGIIIIALEVISFISIIIGLSIMVYGIMSGLNANDLIIISFSFVVASFLIFSFGELLQLLMKIEINTRKTDKDMTKLIKDMEKELGQKIRKH